MLALQIEAFCIPLRGSYALAVMTSQESMLAQGLPAIFQSVRPAP